MGNPDVVVLHRQVRGEQKHDGGGPGSYRDWARASSMSARSHFVASRVAGGDPARVRRVFQSRRRFASCRDRVRGSPSGPMTTSLSRRGSAWISENLVRREDGSLERKELVKKSGVRNMVRPPSRCF